MLREDPGLDEQVDESVDAASMVGQQEVRAQASFRATRAVAPGGAKASTLSPLKLGSCASNAWRTSTSMARCSALSEACSIHQGLPRPGTFKRSAT
jgi:hypothetical protein